MTVKLVRISAGVGSILLLLVLSMHLFQAADAAEERRYRLELVPMALHDVSPPLRTVHPLPPKAGPKRVIDHEIFPDRMVSTASDPAVQTFAGPLISATTGLNFIGVGTGFKKPGGGYYTVNVAPPDPNGAVGATQYVQWVNTAFAVFDKATGTLVYGPADGDTLWAAWPDFPQCGQTDDGDPIVQYDKAANRWILTQLSYSTASSTGAYVSCIAVSQTSDATGAYNRYALQFQNLNDYPKLAVWPDGYYMAFNMFRRGKFNDTFIGPEVCALDRDNMLEGLAARDAQCFQLGSGANSLLPSDPDGSVAPPVGSPNYFLALGKNALQLWKFHADFTNTNNTTLTGPITVPVANFSKACGGGTCIPQKDTSQQLDSLGDRLMYRLAYRNFGTYESLVVNHSVAVSTSGNGGGGKGGNVGPRWYELRNPNGTPEIYQQGTFAPDSTYRWMGSIAMDKVGNIAIGYSASSSTEYPNVRYTGRQPTDPLGTLQAEGVLQGGNGSQLKGLSRWGDYTSLSVDPVEGCTFWYTNEFLAANGTFNWSTRIASFKFPTCQ